MFARKNPMTSSSMGNHAAASAQDAFGSTQHAAQQAFDGLRDAAYQAAPMVERAADRANHLAQQGLQAMRERTQQLGRQADHLAEETRVYVQERPVKSLMMAAVFGAAVAGVLSYLLGAQRQR